MFRSHSMDIIHLTKLENLAVTTKCCLEFLFRSTNASDIGKDDNHLGDLCSLQGPCMGPSQRVIFLLPSLILLFFWLVHVYGVFCFSMSTICCIFVLFSIVIYLFISMLLSIFNELSSYFFFKKKKM